MEIFSRDYGLHGQSSVRRIDLASGTVLQEHTLPARYFGEGIACTDNVLIQLTWRSRKAFVYDRQTLEPRGEFAIPGEGWGITFDGTMLYMSDGSSMLHILDPQTYEKVDEIQVMHDRGPLGGLNELEYVNGEIFANIWPTDIVARVSPKTGAVVGWIDLAGLLDVETSCV